MATAPIKAPPSAKYDALVVAQLAKAERRVRFLDFATGLLAFLALSLGIVAVLVLLHWKWQLSITTRQVILVVYLLGAGAFLTWKVLLPLRRPINPRFAALQLERILPECKNSVVNYLDLRNETLPPAIRGALSRRAAKDAVEADVELAIPGKNVGWAGGIAAGIAVVCLVLMFTIGFRDFFRLLGGILAPLNPTAAGPIVPKNRVTVRLPEGGNASVVGGSVLAIAVRVEGELPPGEEQSPKLILSYAQSKDVVVRQLVKPRRVGADWTADVSALEVRDGFTYKVTAGDAESPDYRVTVFFNPAITKFQAVYQYPAYVGAPGIKVQINNRQLQAWRGSGVALHVQTNGAVKDAEIELSGKESRKTFPATVAAADREAFEVRIEPADFAKYSHYRLTFTPARADESQKAEPYRDPLAYELIAEPDNPPHKVELAKPEKDTLPANGLLKVQGLAEDDIGVKSLTLHMQIVEGEKRKDLKGKPYRTDAELRLPSGGYLKTLAYKDAIDLATVQSADGKPAGFKGGDVLEFWLDARDACDYARPKDHTESMHYRVKLTAPEPNTAQQQKERADASKEQQEHQKKQDEQRSQEDQQRKEDQKEAEAQQQQGDSKAEPQNEKNKADKEGAEAERRAKEEANASTKPSEKPDDKAPPKGEGKDEKEHPAESKPADQKQDGNAAAQQAKNKGDAKPEGKEGEKNKAGESKDKNPGAQGGGKDAGKNEPIDGQKGEGKGADPMTGQGGEKPGQDKNDATPNPTPSASKSGEGKGGDPKDSGGPASAGKSGANAQTVPKAKPQGKEAGTAGKGADEKAAGEAKEQPSESGGAAAKAKEDGPQGQGTSGEAKANEGSAKGNKGETKSGPGQSPDAKTASGGAKPEKGDVSKIDAQNPSMKDLQNVVENLKSRDEEQVGKALQKLEEIGDKAADPNAREFAKKLTDDLKKFVEQKQQEERTHAGEPKPGVTPPQKRPDLPPEDRIADNKTGPGDAGKETGSSKGAKGDQSGNKGTDKGQGHKEKVGDPMTPPDGMGGKPDSTNATVKGPLNPLGRRDDPTEARNPDDPLKPGKVVNPLNQRDTTLQLEKFDPKKYLDREGKVVSKTIPPRTEPKPATTGSQEKIDPKTIGNLPSVGGRQTDPKATSTETIDLGGAAPPPGYRKTVSEFTKIRAQPEK